MLIPSRDATDPPIQGGRGPKETGMEASQMLRRQKPPSTGDPRPARPGRCRSSDAR
jgi:hypothetical protein